MMIYRKLVVFVMLFSAQFLWAQNSMEEMHNQFMQYLAGEKIDSIYNYTTQFTEQDPEYLDGLLFRNELGWVLGHKEQLALDIKALLSIEEYKKPFRYQSGFDPQQFPVSEWPTFYNLSGELLKMAKKNEAMKREMYAVRSILSFLLFENKNLYKNTKKLVSYTDKSSEAYPYVLEMQANSLTGLGKHKKAMKTFDKALKESKDISILIMALKAYDFNKKYDKIVYYQDVVVENDVTIAYLSMGKAHEKLGNTKEANRFFDMFEESIATREGKKVVSYEDIVYELRANEYKELAEHYHNVGQKEKACSYYEMGMKALANSNLNEAQNVMDNAALSEKVKDVIDANIQKEKAALADLNKEIELGMAQCE